MICSFLLQFMMVMMERNILNVLFADHITNFTSLFIFLYGANQDIGYAIINQKANKFKLFRGQLAWSQNITRRIYKVKSLHINELNFPT